ncbi:MAG: DUF3667 domain-containing protein [Bacteroidetes bacterium]|nr:DUF3667 domain-containing protein [Bacteroidota bacterium]
MKCKNCNKDIKDYARFCESCGAKVMDTKISLAVLFQEFMSTYFGWDTSFAKTLRGLITKPHFVISEYLGGVRKRYMPPIVFVSFGVALSSIVMNIYSDEYLNLTSSFGETQLEIIQDSYDEGVIDEKQYQVQLDSIKTSKEIQKITLKYFNIISFLLLPIYALFTLLIFGRKYNYGEHLVINSYLQGLSFFVGLLFILACFYIWEPFFYFQYLFLVIYYSWTFAKLLNYGPGKAVLKFLIFIFLLLGLFIMTSSLISCLYDSK